MAAGYFDFTAGGVLSAANLEDYCEAQSIMRFATTAARDAALVTIKTKGMTCYVTGTDEFYVYDGVSAWQAFSSRYAPAPTTRVHLNTGAITPVANATVGYVVFPNETYDTSNMHTAGDTKIIIPAGKAGLWRVGYSINFPAFGFGQRQAWLSLNRTAAQYAYNAISVTTASVGIDFSGSVDMVCAAGDYIEVGCYQTSGGTMNIGGAYTVLWATYVGP